MPDFFLSPIIGILRCIFLTRRRRKVDTFQAGGDSGAAGQPHKQEAPRRWKGRLRLCVGESYLEKIRPRRRCPYTKTVKTRGRLIDSER